MPRLSCCRAGAASTSTFDDLRDGNLRFREVCGRCSPLLGNIRMDWPGRPSRTVLTPASVLEAAFTGRRTAAQIVSIWRPLRVVSRNSSHWPAARAVLARLSASERLHLTVQRDNDGKFSSSLIGRGTSGTETGAQAQESRRAAVMKRRRPAGLPPQEGPASDRFVD
jgi:hypothetical protein